MSVRAPPPAGPPEIADRCLDFNLEDAQIERLNKVSQIELGFPHDFLTSEVPRNFLYGGLFDRIDPG